ncbi:hypothetical protein [Maricaulis sp.]|uniref:hypothetical protein n=1 Tax=Maricaulis sp. TaxID=1486257 RepID=UPI00262065D9|nr:hypothetical protein [Maricaulis sp.]MDF1769414.1 hypothetical protein [Maricaulis sp.]
MKFAGTAAMRPVEAPDASPTSNGGPHAVTGRVVKRARRRAPPHVTARIAARDPIAGAPMQAILVDVPIQDPIAVAPTQAIPVDVPTRAPIAVAPTQTIPVDAPTHGPIAVAPMQAIPVDAPTRDLIVGALTHGQTVVGPMQAIPVDVPIRAPIVAALTHGRTAIAQMRADRAITARGSIAADATSAAGTMPSAATVSIVTRIDTHRIAVGFAT